MFDFLATLFCLGVATKEDLSRSQTEVGNKLNAHQNNEKFYWGYNRKGRPVRKSTETNEIVTMCVENDELVMKGVYTGRIYENCTQENLNRSLVGKPWHWENFPQWQRCGKPVKLKVENDTGRAFKVYHTGYYFGKVKLKNPGWKKVYLAPKEKQISKFFPDWDYEDIINLTDEEYKYWN